MVEDDVFPVPFATALVTDFDYGSCKCCDDGSVFAMAKSKVDSAVHAVCADSIRGCDSSTCGRDNGGTHVERKLLERHVCRK